MASGKSEEDLLKEIAEKMAKNQISFDSKSEDEKKELVAKIDIVATSQMQELQKSFNNLMGNIDGEIPENARIIVLEGIMNKVETEKLKSIDSVFLSKEVQGFASTIVTEIIKNNKEDIDYKNFVEDNKYSIILSQDALEVKNELPKKYDGYYSTPEDIRNKIANIEEIVGGLNKEELGKKIQRANEGDDEARLEIIVMMSAIPFVETNASFEEMIEIDKVRALEAVDTLAVLYEEIGTEDAIMIAEKLSSKWGVDIISLDETGKKVIDRRKISEFAREKGIDYQRANIDRLKELTQYYENLNGVEDFSEEIKIEAEKNEINRNISVIFEEIRSGKNVEEYDDVLNEMFEEHFDASIRTINGYTSFWVSTDQPFSDEEKKLQLSIIKKVVRLYENEQKKVNNGRIDDYVNIDFRELLEASVQLMKKNKVQDKELLDLMLRVDPKETQLILEATKFLETFSGKTTDENLQQNDTKTQKEITPEIKIGNLVNGLEKRETSKGIEDALDYATSQIENNKSIQTKKDFMRAAIQLLGNRENSYEESERLARKRLFSTVISEKLYDEDILKSMVNIDSTTVKEMIDDLIERQNSKENDNLSTIMDLSSSLKKASNPKVISSENVKVEDIVRNMHKKDDIGEEEYYR